VKLSTHLVRMLRVSGAIPPHTQYALLPWTPFFDSTSPVSNCFPICTYDQSEQAGIMPKAKLIACGQAGRQLANSAYCYVPKWLCYRRAVSSCMYVGYLVLSGHISAQSSFTCLPLVACILSHLKLLDDTSVCLVSTITASGTRLCLYKRQASCYHLVLSSMEQNS
jgi:hypothetical protein